MATADVIRKVSSDWDRMVSGDKSLARLYRKIVDGTCTYRDATKYASMSGLHMGDALVKNMVKAYPDGIISEADAGEILRACLKENHTAVTGITQDVQQAMNRKAKIGLRPVVPEFDEDRVIGLAKELAETPGAFDRLREQVENLSMHTVDESVRQNMRAHESVGLETKVIRTYDDRGLHNGKDICEWCMERAGEWSYSDAIANGVFERHPGCGCEIIYITERNTQIQTDWTSNQWEEADEATLQKRRSFGM